MKCSLGISNFLEEISSLSHSVVFLYVFALIAEEGFLISPCYSLELCIRECQAAMAQVRPRGATPHPRSGQWPRGATPHLRSVAVAKMSYPTSDIRGGGQEELPHVRVQGR